MTEKELPYTIDKPWGREEMLLEDSQIGVKHLIVSPGKMTSYHFHEKKNEVFYVLKGKVKLRLKDSEKVLNTGEYIYLPNHTEHQIINDFDEELTILEFGIPHDNSDVVRVEDPWKR